MKDFQWIYQYALQRFHSADDLMAQLPAALDYQQLIALEDKFLLSTMSRRIFRAGLKHSLVDAKWPAFEQAFFDFQPRAVSLLSDDQLDTLMANRSIIRHWNKIKSVRHNAAMIMEITEEYGSFARWLADWPVEDISGLWLSLKKRASSWAETQVHTFCE